jgi:uncharacterized protein with NRDE domain
MHPKYDLIYMGNRDEFKNRKTQLGSFHEEVLMGKDLKKGGTWMGINLHGELALLTNYRDMSLEKEFFTSRGNITFNFLRSAVEATDYLNELELSSKDYNGYNIILGDMEHLYYYSNISHEKKLLEPGVYGLSNAFLDTPWFKVELGKSILTDLLYDELIDVKDLFSIINNAELSPEHLLPNTGLKHAIERNLSSIHVDMQEYGTVFKQVILIDKSKQVFYYEKSIKDKFTSMNKKVFKIKRRSNDI